MNVFKCPKCGKTTSSREKFCIDCGYQLDIICPECGEKWRFYFDNKFCPGCGHGMKKPTLVKPQKEEKIK
jgi:hypothetical protein